MLNLASCFYELGAADRALGLLERYDCSRQVGDLLEDAELLKKNSQ